MSTMFQIQGSERQGLIIWAIISKGNVLIRKPYKSSHFLPW